MANWAKLQEQLTGKRVVKRAKHGIHFDNGDGTITANFSGNPCHYQDTDGLWKPIDTKLVLMPDGFYGCPHSPVKVKPDGRVKVTGSDYSQFTKLPGSPLGRVDGDKIVREFPGGYQELFVTEDGFREVITVNKRTFPIEKFLAKQSGTLPSAYKTSPQTAVDANGNEFVITSDTKAFGDWLEGAVYPVVIDPDFASSTTYYCLIGYNADFATAKSTYKFGSTTSLGVGIYQPDVFVQRSWIKFNTSTIDDDATITQVNLKMVCTEDNSTVDFDVQIVELDCSGANNDTKYDAILTGSTYYVWRNTSGMVINTQYTSANLTTTWVSKTGDTYYAIRSSRDYDGSATGWESSRIYIGTPNHATESYRPVLSVTYTAAATGTLRRTNMNAQMQNLSGGMHG